MHDLYYLLKDEMPSKENSGLLGTIPSLMRPNTSKFILTLRNFAASSYLVSTRCIIVTFSFEDNNDYEDEIFSLLRIVHVWTNFILTENGIAVVGCIENVVVEEQVITLLEVLLFCDWERASPPSIQN